MTNNDTILVHTADAIVTRGRGPRELEVQALAHNVNLFLGQIEGILEKVPEETGDGKFKLTEFTVSAEISAKGALILMGTGVEAEGKGGLTFKFERKV
jgi:hypothetical protein